MLTVDMYVQNLLLEVIKWIKDWVLSIIADSASAHAFNMLCAVNGYQLLTYRSLSGQSLRAHIFCLPVHIEKYKPTNPILTPLNINVIPISNTKDNPKTHQNSPQSTNFRGGGGIRRRASRATIIIPPPPLQNPVWHPGLRLVQSTDTTLRKELFLQLNVRFSTKQFCFLA